MKTKQALERFPWVHLSEPTVSCHIQTRDLSFDGPVNREVLTECIHGAVRLAEMEATRPGDPNRRFGSQNRLSADAEGALRAIGLID